MKHLIRVLIALSILYCLLTCPAQAYSGNFIVEAGGSVPKTLDLNEGDRVSGRFVVVSHESIINFSILDANQNPILSCKNVGSRSFQFTVLESGVYTLQFENLFSEEAKQVTLNYDVQHYILGFPQEYVLLFVVVGLALGAVAVFAILSPKP